ncbi:MAG TPA: CvpA family protein [Rhizomicrobium sp.]|nr:CvpA family protein [Rhizomicrobium sp.]
MDGSGFTFVDILVVLIMLGSAAYATYRGFVSETLGIFAWVAAVFATLYFGHIAVDLISPHLSPAWLGAVLGYLAVFVVVLVPLEFLSHRISQSVQRSPVSGLDRVLGLLFGLVRGAVVIGLLYFAFSSFQPVKTQPDWMVEARTFPYIQEASAAVLSLAPADTGVRIVDKARKIRKDAVARGQRAGSAPHANTDKKKTYGADERRALDTLIENTDTPEDGKP